MSLPLDKSSIRSTLLQRRDLLSRAEIEVKSAAAQAHLLGLPAFQRAQTLALYSPIRNEVATDGLLTVALAAGRQVCYPCVCGDELRFFQVRSLDDLQLGSFGIGEPDRQLPEVDPALIELLLVPGVAFDRYGHRLGYGRGYFDRLLTAGSFAGLSIGLAYEFQIQDRLPAEEHDRKLGLLVTDREIFSPL
jgi:5-formyltetrahydrofolate cyclo-ligase